MSNSESTVTNRPNPVRWTPPTSGDGIWFEGRLKPHQRDGVAWLRAHPHAVLADDVGLGKTIQALALLAQLDEQVAFARRTPRSVCRVLWLTDATLIEQTKREIQKFVPLFSVATCLDPEFGASQKARIAFEQKYGGCPDVLILSYDMARSRRDWLERTSPTAVVLDEAMKVKGGGRNYEAVCDITSRAERVLSMTATPLENNPLELYRLLKATRAPGLWPEHVFKREFITWRPGRVDRWGKAEMVPDSWQPHRLAEVKSLLADCMLQRSAEDVGLRLPTRVGETHRFVPLTKAQQESYDKAAKKVGTASVGAMESAARASGADSTLTDELMQELAALGDEQAVVYCETLDVLDLVATRLDEAGISHVRVEGKIKDTERATAVAAFSEGAARVLLGSRVLERGLNLQHCRALISLDSSWNPAREQQREGRIRRIGSPHDTFQHLTLLPDTPLTRAKQTKLARKSQLAQGLSS